MRWFWRLLTYLSILVVCPMLGGWLTNKPLAPYLKFPPVSLPTRCAAFSWAAFFLLAGFLLLSISPFLRRVIFSTMKSLPKEEAQNPFPLWGWLGAALMMISWIVAWNRFNWFAPVQEFTFTPLWLSYILVINALSFRRTGQCLLVTHTRYYLALFPLSAILWWGFEYLNRFIENWYYVGVTDFGPWLYFVFATLPFSTVLPAVLGTAEWLNNYPRISADLNRFKPLAIPGSKTLSLMLIVAATAGLIALAIWPATLFFLTWLAPIALVSGLQSCSEKPRLLLDIEVGDWRRIWTLAVAGLICGLFWEMWNFNSLSHWKYCVPNLQRFEIFEMPVLGYAGYLPFGVFCGLFLDFILPLSPLQKNV